MGSLEDVEGSNDSNLRKNGLSVDLSCAAIRQVDSQSSPGGDFRGDRADDCHCLTNTMPIDDTFLLEDADETQLVDVAGETQLVDLSGETQLMDLAGETQPMDLAGETQLMDLAGETQPIDLADETQPMDLSGETQPMDLAGETQPIDLADETQPMDLAGETQLMDLVGETQVLDDLDRLKNVPSKLLSMHNIEVDGVSENGGTNKSKLCDTQQLSLDDTMKADGGDSVTQVNMEDSYPCKLGDIVSGPPSDTCSTEKHFSGSVCKGFTSIRAASIRASGLAARGKSCSMRISKSPLKQWTFEQKGTSLVVDLPKHARKNGECLWNGYSDDCEKLSNPNKCKAGPVRKLFTEDRVAGVGQAEADINHTDDNLHKPEFHDSENCLAGLSYANSQEPGELSQANALEVVDRFLELNAMDYDQGYDYRIHIAEKPEVVSGAKGSRDLAKTSILKNKDGECQVYDWDDNREDEGGGDFFLKKRELFFDKRSPKERLCTEPRKFKGPGLRSIETVGDHGIGKEQAHKKKKLGLSTDLDSGLMLHKIREKGKSLSCNDDSFHKNQAKDLQERSDVASGHKLPNNYTSQDIPEMENIGPDTQMAAETMETLCFEVHLADGYGNDPDEGVGDITKATRKSQASEKAACLQQSLTQKMPYPSSVGVVTRQPKRVKRTCGGTISESSLSSAKQTRNIRKRCDAEPGDTEKRRLINDDGISCGKKCPRTSRLKMKEQKEGGAGKRSAIHEIEPYNGTGLTGPKLKKKRCVVEQLDSPVPVTHQPRKCTKLKSSKASVNSADAREEINDLTSASARKKRRTAAKDNNAEMGTIEKFRKVKSTAVKQSSEKYVGTSSNSNSDALVHLERKRAQMKALLDGKEVETQCNSRLKKSRTTAASISLNPGRNHANHPSTSNCTAMLSSDGQAEKVLLQQTVDNEISRNNAPHSGSDHGNAKANLNDTVEISASMQCNGKGDTRTLKSAEGADTIGRLDASPRERCGTSFLTCTPPGSRATPINNASPICMGDEYLIQSCRKKLSKFSLVKEIDRLIPNTSLQVGGMKNLRKRKDTSNIRVLFSQHLNADDIKQQKKILARLGATDASSMLDATHFVADEFVRTRNMLEAIAFGKPVVTQLWLESCGQTGCFVNEKNYILRDARKEKEFGFCMSVSLSRACQHPLLQGQKVFVTPNTKPGKDIIINLVKAVHGLAVERLGRSVLKDEKLPDDLLILSCEEDYDVCVPFLEKGGCVYSSELLLNGIVKQKLEYERHRLFEDHVKRTRSTIWVKKNRITKCK